ncbi:dimethylarginine dimethylaminohydrolase family protein [Tepidamorphus sp. 3E244]|uniref:dimethylarginine dimethylaminohydrolase family protein n=1 Tax=Tepidamorphus sp. 3E244 TaxID=3385498 RepID=UPI0038FC62D5
MTDRISHRFNTALVREPAQSIAHGLRDGDGPDPDPAAFSEEFHAYVGALRRAGVTVKRLPALEAFPDSVFIEDPALCLPDTAVLLRPGAQSRIGEAAELEPALRGQIATVRKLAGPGHVDGGDIMVTGSEVIVGLSARTDREGFDELAEILRGWGYAARCVETPPGVLHLKTASAVLADDTVLCTPQMAESDVFEGYRIIETAPGEEASANAIRVNDTVLVSAGYPETTQRIREAMPEVIVEPLSTAQAARVDGGLSCMSLRFFQSE